MDIQHIAKQLHDIYNSVDVSPIILTPHEAGMLIALFNSLQPAHLNTTYYPDQLGTTMGVQYTMEPEEGRIAYSFKYITLSTLRNNVPFRLYLDTNADGVRASVIIVGDITPVPYTIPTLQDLAKQSIITEPFKSTLLGTLAIKKLLQNGLNIVDAIRLMVFVSRNGKQYESSHARVLELRDVATYFGTTYLEHISLVPAQHIATLPRVKYRDFQLLYPIGAVLHNGNIVFSVHNKNTIYNITTSKRIVDGLAAIAMLYSRGWIALIPATYTSLQLLEKDRLLIAKRVGEVQAVARAQEFAYAPSHAYAEGFKDVPILHKEALWRNICASTTTLTPQEEEQLIQTMKEMDIYNKYTSGMSKATICALLEGQYKAEYGTRLKLLPTKVV